VLDGFEFSGVSLASRNTPPSFSTSHDAPEAVLLRIRWSDKNSGGSCPVFSRAFKLSKTVPMASRSYSQRRDLMPRTSACASPCANSGEAPPRPVNTAQCCQETTPPRLFLRITAPKPPRDGIGQIAWLPGWCHDGEPRAQHRAPSRPASCALVVRASIAAGGSSNTYPPCKAKALIGLVIPAMNSNG